MEFFDRIIKPKFSGEEERRFRHWYSEKNLYPARLVQFQIFLVFIAAGYLDYVLLGELATLMIFMRYLLFTPLLIVIIVYTFTPYFKKHMQYTFCIAMGITACYVSLFTLLNADAVAMIYFVGSIIVVFVGFIYAPMLFNYAMGMAVFIFIICMMGVYFNKSFSSEIVEACMLLLLGTLLIALAACYTHERHARENYLYEKSLNLQKDTLQESNIYLQELATIDGLTGIANRRAFDTRLKDEWKRAERTKSHLSVLLLDIDFFKLYNDGYGHQKGDECLIRIAKALQLMVRRPGDFVARYGGEEFVFIVSDSDPDKVLLYAEAIRDTIEQLKISHEYSKVSPYVTSSLGVANIMPSQDEDINIEQLIRLADRALYQAKSDGRNIVIDSLKLA